MKIPAGKQGIPSEIVEVDENGFRTVEVKTYCICCGRKAQTVLGVFIFICDLHFNMWDAFMRKSTKETPLATSGWRNRWNEEFTLFLHSLK